MGIFVKSTPHPSIEDLKKASDMAFKVREDYEKRINKSVKKTPDSFFNNGL